MPEGRDSHPRPVWGAWSSDRLHLSIGSPVIARRTVPPAPATVHLGSGTDVVIVDGSVEASTTADDVIGVYRDKYDREYLVDEFGPLTTIAPSQIIGWRSAGWAGRGGFRKTGRWTYRDGDS